MTEQALINKVFPNSYIIGKKLGEGSFGKVYKATTDKNKKVAIKFTAPLQNDRNLDNDYTIEVGAYATLYGVPSIPPLAGFGSDFDPTRGEVTSFMVLPLYDSSLRDWEMNLDIVDRIDHFDDLSIQMLNALYYLDLNGIVHGDIKEENILVDIDNRSFYLADYGLSRQLGCDPTLREGDQYGYVYTSSFRAPEVVANEGWNVKADVWAMGVTFLDYLSGGRTFWAPRPEPGAPQVLEDLVPWVDGATLIKLKEAIRSDKPTMTMGRSVDAVKWLRSVMVQSEIRLIPQDFIALIEDMLVVVQSQRPKAEELIAPSDIVPRKKQLPLIERQRLNFEIHDYLEPFLVTINELLRDYQAFAVGLDLAARYISLQQEMEEDQYFVAVYASMILACEYFRRDFNYELLKQEDLLDDVTYAKMGILATVKGEIHVCEVDLLSEYIREIGLENFGYKLDKVDGFILDLPYNQMIDYLKQL